MGVETPTERTFFVEDTKRGSRIMYFSRSMVLQSDGNQESKWSEVSPRSMRYEHC